MLYGHIAAVAGAEACENGKLAENIFQFLHIFLFLRFVEELVEACFAEAVLGAVTSGFYQSLVPVPLLSILEFLFHCSTSTSAKVMLEVVSETLKM